MDFCGRFIDASMKIQRGKVLQYGSQQVAKLPSEADPSRVQFKQVHRRGFFTKCSKHIAWHGVGDTMTQCHFWSCFVLISSSL